MPALVRGRRIVSHTPYRLRPKRGASARRWRIQTIAEIITQHDRTLHGCSEQSARLGTPETRRMARMLHQIDPAGGQCSPPLGRGDKEVQAELARKKCGGQLALHTIAGCIEPRREGTQPAVAR
jgi:hypothetical protein